jgi:hypothetical protein
MLRYPQSSIIVSLINLPPKPLVSHHNPHQYTPPISWLRVSLRSMTQGLPPTHGSASVAKQPPSKLNVVALPKHPITHKTLSLSKLKTMTTIIIKPKSNEEKDLLTLLLKKMNIEVSVVEEPVPNYKTEKAIEDVELKKGTRTRSSKELFNELGI